MIRSYSLLEMQGIIKHARRKTNLKEGASPFPLQQHILIDIIYVLNGFRL